MNWEAFKKMTFKQKLFSIFVIMPIFFLFILPIAKTVSKKLDEKKRYKKIIKKGLFWDTEYLVEKEINI